ncbi:hypothetical protein, partial [Alicyclobacillus shizuokensis]|uniref:hypothetical protein n=1 Tax=Alicyclobacillus shizuokensis TaxID=392014 RepID=UPI000B0A068F
EEQSEEQSRELLKAQEKLLEKDEELKRVMDDYEAGIERESQERNLALSRKITELLAENDGLKEETQALKTEVELLKTTSQEEHKQLKAANEELLAENQTLRKNNEELKKQAMQPEPDSLVSRKTIDENEKPRKRILDVDLLNSLERLKTENERLRMELANLKNSSGESNIEGRANEYADLPKDSSVSFIPESKTYESLFSVKIDTPHVHPDPAVWNLIYSSVPPGYSIPDPEFISELSRHVATGKLKPAASSRTLSYREYLDTFRDVLLGVAQQADNT